MTRTTLRAVRVATLLAAAACTEKIAAPGECPQFCPSASVTVIDTTLRSAISRDSSFGRPIGYSSPYSAISLLAQSLPGIRDSRPILHMGQIAFRLPLINTDTTTGAVTGVDSLVLRLTLTTRDSQTHNLAVQIYKLPQAIDSTTTFASLLQPFTDSLIRRVNVDSLIAQPGRKDPVTHDSVVVDSVNHRISLFIRLDSARVPIAAPDSGAGSFGVRVTADTLASVAFGAAEFTGVGPLLNWYVRVDSLGQAVAHRLITRSPTFDSFVFDPPPPALDANLAVGGVPAARTVLRLAFPRTITDSSQVIRATLEFLPAVVAQGTRADSFGLAAYATVADFGAKSPLDTHADTAIVHTGVADTVRVDITNILRFWIADTLAPTTIVLRQVPEGASFSEIRFYPSTDALRGPVLRLTYAKPFPFGKL